MTISLSGLKMPWLSDPEKRLPPSPPKPRVNWSEGRAKNIAIPYFVGDIKPFVNVANPERTEEITSRSQLRAFERSFGCHQVGNDFKPGEIAAKNEAKLQAREELAKGIESGWAEVD